MALRVGARIAITRCVPGLSRLATSTPFRAPFRTAAGGSGYAGGGGTGLEGDSQASGAWKDDTPIPAFTLRPLPRPNEPLTNMKRRLYYESRKRGILENDLLLGNFAHKHLDELTLDELRLYDDLLDENDWEIYYWATNARDPPAKYKGRVLDLIKEIAKNKEKVVMRQPDAAKNTFQ